MKKEEKNEIKSTAHSRYRCQYYIVFAILFSITQSCTNISTAKYASLLTSGKLNGYLAEIERQAEEMFSRLVKQMAQDEGITEKLKANDMMTWVGKMNGIWNQAKHFWKYY